MTSSIASLPIFDMGVRVAHWLLTYVARVRSLWSAVVVCERVWLVAHSDTWVFSGCSGYLPQKWPPSAKHPCIIQDPIGNKLSSFHGLSCVNMYTYVFTEYTFVFLFCFFKTEHHKTEPTKSVSFRKCGPFCVCTMWDAYIKVYQGCFKVHGRGHSHT
jgi:hypothetical protein